jgi:uncharacterized repeat protein (TIGR04138 family)
MTDHPEEFRRTGFVSLWVGTFPSVEAAEAYFGIPDEIGAYLPPEAFAADCGLGDFPPENLEVNFEQVSPRPLRELLADATFSTSFLDQAVEAANRQGIYEAQGIALLYDFDYRAKRAWFIDVGPLRFIGTFPYVRIARSVNLQPFRELAAKIGCSLGAVIFVTAAAVELSKKRRGQDGGQTGHVSARELCEHLLTCRGEESTAMLRELGLLRSEDVGRIVFGLVNAGIVRRQESDSEADFQGLFALE